MSYIMHTKQTGDPVQFVLIYCTMLFPLLLITFILFSHLQKVKNLHCEKCYGKSTDCMCHTKTAIYTQVKIIVKVPMIMQSSQLF